MSAAWWPTSWPRAAASSGCSCATRPGRPRRRRRGRRRRLRRPGVAARGAGRGRPRLHGLAARGPRAAHAPPPHASSRRRPPPASPTSSTSRSWPPARTRSSCTRARTAPPSGCWPTPALAFTAIRNSMYADDIPGWFDAEGVNTVPGGDGRMSFSYRPELARAIAVTLTEPGHEGKVYDIVTPQAVSMRELAEIAWAVSGLELPLRADRATRTGRRAGGRAARRSGRSRPASRPTRRCGRASSTSSPATTAR